MTAPRRKHISRGVKIEAVLLQLGLDPSVAATKLVVRPTLLKLLLRMAGLDPDDVEWSHEPALALRDRNEDDTYTPDELDPHFIFARSSAKHDEITNGRGGEKRITTAGSDQHIIHKLPRLRDEHAAFQQRVLAKTPGERRKPSRWASRKMQGRGFETRRSG
jgi:hypothetical protein